MVGGCKEKGGGRGMGRIEGGVVGKGKEGGDGRGAEGGKGEGEGE